MNDRSSTTLFSLHPQVSFIFGGGGEDRNQPRTIPPTAKCQRYLFHEHSKQGERKIKEKERKKKWERKQKRKIKRGKERLEHVWNLRKKTKLNLIS